MKTIVQLAVAFAPLLLAGRLPFVRVLRGAPMGRWFLICWFLLVFWMFMFCFVIPLSISALDRELGGEAFKWVPEGPAAVAMLFTGWMPAALITGLALLIRTIRDAFQNSETPPK